MNEIIGDKTPNLPVDSSSQLRIKGDQHIQTGPWERDALDTNRAAEMCKLPQGIEN